MSPQPQRNPNFPNPNIGQDEVYPTWTMPAPDSNNVTIVYEPDGQGNMTVYETKTVVVKEPLSNYSSRNPKLFRSHAGGMFKALVKQPLSSAETIFAIIGFLFTLWLVFAIGWRGVTSPQAKATKTNSPTPASIWFR